MLQESNLCNAYMYLNGVFTKIEVLNFFSVLHFTCYFVDIYRNMYEELRKRLKDATQNVDLTNFNLNSIHSRFEFQPEPIVRKNSV